MADAPEQELDEDGLVVQKYHSQVLVVMPPEGFGDQTLRYARSSLYNVHVGTLSVAPDAETEVKGRLQDVFLVDEALEGQTMDAFSGILVVASEGANPLADDARVLELVRAADRDGKLVATWGNGLAVLARAGVVSGRKVTGAVACKEEAVAAGARFRGREVVIDGHLVTARDEGAGMRFGQALADQVRI
jgi:putative intracellular protease/amidase